MQILGSVSITKQRNFPKTHLQHKSKDSQWTWSWLSQDLICKNSLATDRNLIFEMQYLTHFLHLAPKRIFNIMKSKDSQLTWSCFSQDLCEKSLALVILFLSQPLYLPLVLHLLFACLPQAFCKVDIVSSKTFFGQLKSALGIIVYLFSTRLIGL